MREAIEHRIQEYLAATDPRLEWVREGVREGVRAHRFLPLCFSLASAMCVRPDGTFVWWSEDGMAPLLDGRLQRGALLQAARRWPELAALILPRPDAAVDCNGCEGTGRARDMPPELASEVSCWCGGIGWVMPEEQIGG